MKKAFTLAEVLTTLTVIGVIAVVVLPALNSSVDTKVLEKQKATSEFKLKDGLHRMQIKSELAKEYESTEDFVNAMKKYFNFTTVCSNTELTRCFGKKLRVGSASYDLSNIRTSDQIDMQFATPANVNGLVFSDGTRALIAYDKGCYISNIYDTTIDVTKCFAMYLDINGTNGHTVLDEDVIGLNTGVKDIEIGEVYSTQTFTIEQCQDAQNAGAPINICSQSTTTFAYSAWDCWYKGKRLPSSEEFRSLASKIYEGTPIKAKGITENLSIKNKNLHEKLNGICLWAAEQCGDNCAHYRCFGENSTVANDGNGRTITFHSTYKYFCVDK